MSSQLNPVYIVDALRTPVGKRGGLLNHLALHELAAPLVMELLQRQSLDGNKVDEVVLGNAAGPGGNPARVTSLAAGLAAQVPGVTVDRQCGSGLEAIHYAARLMQGGGAQLVIAGGAESTSNAPLRVNSRTREFYQRAPFTPPGMDDPDMGIAAENVAREFGVNREDQDHFALLSHQKAAAANDSGLLEPERFCATSFAIDRQTLDANRVDECIRPDTSLAALSRLAPVFESGGTVTAGNACPLHLLGSGPIPATRQLLQRNSLDIDDIAAIEFNEAFAAQVLACQRELRIDPERMNRRGGALALGHPFGASGAMLVVRLFHQLEPGQLGLATIGIGGGMGLSALFRAL